MPPELCYNDEHPDDEGGDDDGDDLHNGTLTPTTTTTTRVDNGIMTPLEIHGFGGDDDEDHGHDEDHCGGGGGDPSKRSHRVQESTKARILGLLRAYFRKYRGCGHRGPQPLCRKQTAFTFLGSFFTIYLIHLFNVYITTTRMWYSSGGNNDGDGDGGAGGEEIPFDYETATDAEIVRHVMEKNFGERSEDFSAWPPLVMGPFGASVILIFAMTTAAPSQPRSMLGGATIGMLVGKLVGMLGHTGGPFVVDIGVRMSLAAALTAVLQAVTCTIYPPGGALAIIFSSQLLGWSNFLPQIVGTVLAITMGVIFNNLHPRRTYPTFWIGIEQNRKRRNHNKTINDDSDSNGNNKTDSGGGCR